MKGPSQTESYLANHNHNRDNDGTIPIRIISSRWRGADDEVPLATRYVRPLTEVMGPDLLGVALVSLADSEERGTHDSGGGTTEPTFLVVLCDIEAAISPPSPVSLEPFAQDALNIAEEPDDLVRIVGPRLSLAERLAERERRLRSVLGSSDSKIMMKNVHLSGLWEGCYKGNFKLVESVANGEIVHDTGVLSAICQAVAHKRAVLNKFEKYVVFYGLTGSVVRGSANADSDFDVVIVIDDSDLQRMARDELEHRLAAIITGMAVEAPLAEGMRSRLHATTIILSDAWRGFRQSDPVVISLLRDSVPLYDRGWFLSWRYLLESGQIESTIEAARRMAQAGLESLTSAERKAREAVQQDLFQAVVLPTQAVFSLLGEPLPPPKEMSLVVPRLELKGRPVFSTEDVKVVKKLVETRRRLDHGEINVYSLPELLELLQMVRGFQIRVQDVIDKLLTAREVQEIRSIAADCQQTASEIMRLVTQDFVVERDESVLIQESLAHGDLEPRVREGLSAIAENLFRVLKKGDMDYATAFSHKRAAYRLKDTLSSVSKQIQDGLGG